VSLPVRVRLTVWYAVLLAAILLAIGTFLVLRLSSDLEQRLDREIAGGARPIAEAYATGGASEFFEVTRAILPPGQGAAQVLDRSGEVLLSAGVRDGGRAFASARARAEALVGDPSMEAVRIGDVAYRAHVSPVRRLGRRHVLVVAESRAGVEESVRRVLVLLLLAGPVALAATGLVGWFLARKSLLPVERMTAEAQAIEIDRLDERIAVPKASDELRRLAVTLNAMLDRLELGVAEKHQLVSDASHELRTPLAVMRAELDVSLRGDELTPEARAVLESTREEVWRMSRTVENLLTLAQADEGRLPLLVRRVELREAIDQAARPLQPLAEAKALRLEVRGSGEAAAADPERLHQALTNLLENAIKYTPGGGVVRVSSWARDGEAGVTVADDGPGIPADVRERVFDRFYRVDSARGRDAGGSGLGLAICREIVRAHGGRLWVDAAPGGGSAFNIALPIG
jgi:heavy metal sensor kinase